MFVISNEAIESKTILSLSFLLKIKLKRNCCDHGKKFFEHKSKIYKELKKKKNRENESTKLKEYILQHLI